MERRKSKGFLKLIFKVTVSAVAIYVVIQKIDLVTTKEILLRTGIMWLILGFLAFNLSKVLSSFRLNLFFRAIDLVLTWFYNLKLYYVGMFYNLFLPGGIGGDGYKIYILKKNYSTDLKFLISSTLLDRISGMMALVFLALFLFLFLSIPVSGSWIKWMIISMLILSYPIFYLISRLLFRRFIPVFFRTSFYSLGVQLLQLLCAFFLLKSLSVEASYLEYMILFLLSSVVAVLPFTIGGVGARELVFIFGANYLYIDKNTAVAFSILFFIITAVSSFTGIFLETGAKTENAYQQG